MRKELTGEERGFLYHILNETGKVKALFGTGPKDGGAYGVFSELNLAMGQAYQSLLALELLAGKILDETAEDPGPKVRAIWQRLQEGLPLEGEPKPVYEQVF